MELESYKEKIKENREKFKLNKQLPYLVGNVVEDNGKTKHPQLLYEANWPSSTIFSKMEGEQKLDCMHGMQVAILTLGLSKANRMIWSHWEMDTNFKYIISSTTTMTLHPWLSLFGALH